MKKDPRSLEQIRRHYEVEKGLADRLRRAAPEERRKMYGGLYDELYRSIDDHPLLTRKSQAAEEEGAGPPKAVLTQLKFLRNFLTPDTKFLEVGAGSCLLSLEVAKQVKEVYAVDVSQEMTKRSSFPANFHLVLFDGCRVPQGVGGIRVAYSHQVMEHVHPDDAIDQLRSIYESLLPGGMYVCIVPNRINGPHDISRHFDKVATGFHMKEYTTGELSRIFRKVGFSKVASFVGARGTYLRVPQFALRIMESCMALLPFGLRRRSDALCRCGCCWRSGWSGGNEVRLADNLLVPPGTGL